MNDYYLFVAIAIVAILSPGPGVLLTLTNALRYKVRGAVSGILGIAFGTFVVAGISATSLGILLMTSATAYTVMRYIGAIYLIYLGLKLWRSAPTGITAQPPSKTNRQRRLQFFEGMMIQITNPKAVFFFISIFPQFIDYSSASIGYFALLVITYSGLIIIIHGLYALMAQSAHNWFSSARGGLIINRAGGTMFICFGIGLASTTNK